MSGGSGSSDRFGFGRNEDNEWRGRDSATSASRRIASLQHHLTHTPAHQVLQQNATEAGGVNSDIYFETFPTGHIIVLNRPEQLNALNTHMIRSLKRWLQIWSNTSAMVIIKGAGKKAFCAGGDIRALAYAARDKDSSVPRNFFGPEYQIVSSIFKYPKPYVALLNGITMGGGVGMSIGAKFRIASEKLLFAMPETGIGFVVDVGASYFLPRLQGPSGVGLYIGLTSARLGAADAHLVGIATHFVKSERMDELEECLKALTSPTKHTIAEVLDKFKSDPGTPPMLKHSTLITYCFGEATSPEDIFVRLQSVADGYNIPNDVQGVGDSDAQEWARNTLKTLLTKSPLSIKVVYHLIKRGSSLDIDRALELEYRIAMRMVMKTPDFYEGVRAVIIEKDNRPQWGYKSVGGVDTQYALSLFDPFSAEEIKELGPELSHV